MKSNLKQLLELMIPSFIIGIVLALFIGIFIMLSYVMLWGIFIGAIIWVVLIVKNYFFSTPPVTSKKGRIIDHREKD